ncbi:MAG: general secretion pathway protein GspK [Myxococcales bacterium]|nr:general secretion pathway protein GspK [Myxococcales bacterium]MCB9709266.1 general secretion pathway protein GspK [Myxococcales bacterium]
MTMTLHSRSHRHRKQQGVALIVTLSAIAILAVMVADMHDNVRTSYEAANAKRDELRAEYLAISGISLTRLLIANEPMIRQAVGPLLQALVQKAPPQLPIWQFANEALAPFANLEGVTASGAALGLDFSQAEGLSDTGGTFSITACAESVKLNVNKPLSLQGDSARLSVAVPVFTLLGGYQSPSAYDAMFAGRDADGQISSRTDIVSALIDWWDFDQVATQFDPGARTITSVGSEDNIYHRFEDPYETKNAPYDSLEELHLIRGITDEFWATFVRPDPSNACEDLMTVYGGDTLNPNLAKPESLLAKVCASLTGQPLCVDAQEGARFVQLVGTIRSMFPLPWFSRGGDFLDFLEGKGGENDLFPLLTSFMGGDPSLLFTPVVISQDIRAALEKQFTVESHVITIQSVAKVQKAEVRIRSVVNFHNRWSPPPPNSGTMPSTGIFHYWRFH